MWSMLLHLDQKLKSCFYFLADMIDTAINITAYIPLVKCVDLSVE